MPLRVRVDRDRKIIFVEGEGIVADDDLLSYVEEYLGGDDLRGFDELFDLSGADLVDLTYAGLASVAAAAAATDPDAATDPGTEPIKIAILVSETLALGLSRLYQSLRESKGGRRYARVFQNRSECCEWLGIDS